MIYDKLVDKWFRRHLGMSIVVEVFDVVNPAIGRLKEVSPDALVIDTCLGEILIGMDFIKSVRSAVALDQ